MSDNSAIEWTEATWNPVTGCTKVSPGCDYCYAERITERFHGPGSFERIVLHPDRLDKPLRWRKPRWVFVNSMSDVFHDAVPDEFIAQVFAVMARAPQHTFQCLTKRHGRMRSLLGMDGQVMIEAAPDEATAQVLYEAEWPLPNVWLGVSVEDQKWADIRIPALLETPAAVRFLSCEPLLGPVDLRSHLAGHCPEHDFPGGFCVPRDHTGIQHLHWVIVGGESGPGHRSMDLSWAQQIVDQCARHGSAVFVKQLGAAHGRHHHDIATFPIGLQVREYPKEVADVR